MTQFIFVHEASVANDVEILADNARSAVTTFAFAACDENGERTGTWTPAANRSHAEAELATRQWGGLIRRETDGRRE